MKGTQAVNQNGLTRWLVVLIDGLCVLFLVLGALTLGIPKAG